MKKSIELNNRSWIFQEKFTNKNNRSREDEKKIKKDIKLNKTKV